MIGVDRGAMIIAPMTVAVESASTPAVAMIAESTSMVQNADCLARVSPERRSRSSDSSSRVRRWFSGSTRSRRPMFMAPSMPPSAAGWPRGSGGSRPGETAAGRPSARRYRRGARRSSCPHLTAPPARSPCCRSLRSPSAGCSDDGHAEPDADPVVDGTSRQHPGTEPPSPHAPSPTGTASPSGSAVAERHGIGAGRLLARRGQLARASRTSVATSARSAAVRVGGHPGYDRVVWQFPGSGRPSFQVKYVDQPIDDGSGDVVDGARRRLPRGAGQLGRHPAGERAATGQRLRRLARRHRGGRGPAGLRRLRGRRPDLRRACATASARSGSPC